MKIKIYLQKYTLLSILLICLQYISIAQLAPDQNYINQSKYWFYRNRLINEFCKVGPNAGESLPLQSINYVGYNGSAKYAYVGDGSLAKVGHYMGVLATELKLLKMNSQSTANTCRELYYAIAAVKRLDVTAESYFLCDQGGYPNNNPDDGPGIPYLLPAAGCTGTIGNQNGFLIRSDIDPRNGINFKKWSDGSIPAASDIYKYFNNMTGIKIIESDFKANIQGGYDGSNGSPLQQNYQGNKNPVSLNDMSHDQLNNLLIGFRLVQTMLDGSETYSDNGNVINLKNFAQQVISPILVNMANGSSNTGNYCTAIQNYTTFNQDAKTIMGKSIALFSDQASFLLPVCSPGSPCVLINKIPWMISNPVTGFPSSIDNGPGAGYPVMISRAYATTANLLTGNSFYVASQFDHVWNTIKMLDAAHMNDNWKILAQVAIGDSWNNVPCQKVCWKTHKFFVPTPIPCPDYLSCVSSGSDRLQRESAEAHYEVLPLLYNVLFGKTGFNNAYTNFESFYTSHINSAPCVGPYSYQGTSSPPFSPNTALGDWGSWNLLYSAHRGSTSPWSGYTDYDQGEYNGLDYMLLYNLYNIYKGNPNPYYINYDNNLNLSNRTVTAGKSEYYNARGYKDIDQSYKNGTITVNSFTVNSSGYANMRAGDAITFLPGVSINSGATFDAIIYKPTNNWEWEMSICSDGPHPSGSPAGSAHKMVANIKSNANTNSNPIDTKSDLGDCYPNPTDGLVDILYSVGEEGVIELSIKDAYGKHIATLVSKEKHEVGNFTVKFDTSHLNPGIYHYMLKSKNKVYTKKMMVIK